MQINFVTNNAQIREDVAHFVKIWENESSYFESKTSGSTGKPKLIRIQKKHAIASARGTIQFLKLQANSNALLCLNTQTIGGKMMLIRSIVHHLNLFVTEPAANPLKNIDFKIDFIAIAPLQLDAILDENPEKLKAIKHVIVGGGQISPAILNKLKQHRIWVYQTFGMTETISHIALRKVGIQESPFYTTLEGITVSQENNLLCIDAKQLGIKRLVTNDLIELISYNQFRWIGRADFVVNSGGIKIQLDELEISLAPYLNTSFFLFGKEDERLGEKLLIAVEGKRQAKFTAKTFYSFMENPYHIPKGIIFMEQFNYTSSHKINRISTIQKIKSNEIEKIL